MYKGLVTVVRAIDTRVYPKSVQVKETSIDWLSRAWLHARFIFERFRVQILTNLFGEVNVISFLSAQE